MLPPSSDKKQSLHAKSAIYYMYIYGGLLKEKSILKVIFMQYILFSYTLFTLGTNTPHIIATSSYGPFQVGLNLHLFDSQCFSPFSSKEITGLEIVLSPNLMV